MRALQTRMGSAHGYRRRCSDSTAGRRRTREGLARVVALMAGVESISDVIDFPKTGNGYDPMTQAHAPITPQQRKESGIDAKPQKLEGA